MSGSLLTGLVVAAALGAGLMAGLFFAFSAFVMEGLGRLPPAQGIAAMQSINVAVLNPVFLTVFVGTAVLGALLAVGALLGWGRGSALAVVAGALLYIVGTFGVTMAFNVPLNDRLAAAAPDSAEGTALWRHYLVAWTAWNHVRTIGALAATAAFIAALR
jgi:uncharacterized membrane protein